MAWVKAILGAMCVLLGLVWIGQCVGLLPGTIMSGQMVWAIIGLVLLVLGGWLLWSFVRGRRAVDATRA